MNKKSDGEGAPESNVRRPVRRPRLWLYHKSSTASCTGQPTTRFRIVHPFHPLFGSEYELVFRRLNWGEDRVYFYDADGKLKSFLTTITDLGPGDDFTRISAGRSAFRVDDLLRLRDLLDRHISQRGEGHDM